MIETRGGLVRARFNETKMAAGIGRVRFGACGPYKIRLAAEK